MKLSGDGDDFQGKKSSGSRFACLGFEYALQGGWNVQFTRWGGVKFEAKCGVEVDEGEIPCSWRIYCSYEESVGLWMVKTFHDVHSCFKDGRCKILSDTIIAKMFLNEVPNLIFL
ncbi:hypothetical protein Bca4012_074423 [Brassica carinata]